MYWIDEHSDSVLSRTYDHFTEVSPNHVRIMMMNDGSGLEYESQVQYQHDFHDLKKSIRDCICGITKIQPIIVLSTLHELYNDIKWMILRFHSPSLQDPSYEGAILLLMKGFLEGLKGSPNLIGISNMEVKSLFLTLQSYLFFGNCSRRSEVLQSLGLLSNFISLSLVRRRNDWSQELVSWSDWTTVVCIGESYWWIWVGIR